MEAEPQTGGGCQAGRVLGNSTTPSVCGQNPLVVMPHAVVRVSECGAIRFDIQLKD